MRKEMIAAREAVKAAKAAKKSAAKSDSSSSSKRKAAQAIADATTATDFVVVSSGDATDAVQTDERKTKKVCVLMLMLHILLDIVIQLSHYNSSITVQAASRMTRYVFRQLAIRQFAAVHMTPVQHR
jgi:hypothetical protein